MICPYCGAQQQSKSIYCDNCGQQLPALHTEEPTPQKHPFRFWLVSLILLPILLIIGIALYAMHAPQPTEPESSVLPAPQVWNGGTAALLWSEDVIDSEADRQALCNRLQEVSTMLQMPVGIQLSDEPISDDDTAREQAIADFTEQFPDATDGVFLYLDLTEPEPGQTYNSHDYFLTYGAAQLYYTNAPDYNRIAEIFAQVNAACEVEQATTLRRVELFCTALEETYQEGIPDGYYVQDSDTGQYLYESDGEIGWHDTLPEE